MKGPPDSSTSPAAILCAHHLPIGSQAKGLQGPSNLWRAARVQRFHLAAKVQLEGSASGITWVFDLTTDRE